MLLTLFLRNEIAAHYMNKGGKEKEKRVGEHIVTSNPFI